MTPWMKWKVRFSTSKKRKGNGYGGHVTRQGVPVIFEASDRASLEDRCVTICTTGIDPDTGVVYSPMPIGYTSEPVGINQ